MRVQINTIRSTLIELVDEPFKLQVEGKSLFLGFTTDIEPLIEMNWEEAEDLHNLLRDAPFRGDDIEYENLVIEDWMQSDAEIRIRPKSVKHRYLALDYTGKRWRQLQVLLGTLVSFRRIMIGSQRFEALMEQKDTLKQWEALHKEVSDKVDEHAGKPWDTVRHYIARLERLVPSSIKIK